MLKTALCTVYKDFSIYTGSKLTFICDNFIMFVSQFINISEKLIKSE